jgi:hypothetical protein
MTVGAFENRAASVCYVAIVSPIQANAMLSHDDGKYNHVY